MKGERGIGGRIEREGVEEGTVEEEEGGTARSLMFFLFFLPS